MQLRSKIEYLSEQGGVVTAQQRGPVIETLRVLSSPESPQDFWAYEFGRYELEEPENANLLKRKGNKRGEGPDGVFHKDPEKRKRAKNYTVTVSGTNYIILNVLKWLNLPNTILSYEYTEFDRVPFILQVFLHIPLVLTGVIIFVVVLTLDPEFSNSVVRGEINKLPSFHYTEALDLADCPVCLDEFTEGQEVRTLGCKHSFHKECIDAWLLNALKCPICRKAISDTAGAPQIEMYQTYYYV